MDLPMEFEMVLFVKQGLATELAKKKVSALKLLVRRVSLLLIPINLRKRQKNNGRRVSFSIRCYE